MPKGIFNNPSRYCRAFVVVSSDFDLISRNFTMAFSFTVSVAFNKHICCSSVMFPDSYFDIVFVYETVCFIVSLKYCLTFHGKLLKSTTWSLDSTCGLNSFDNMSYNK